MDNDLKRILELESFGVGYFSEQELTEKIEFIKKLMAARPLIPEHPRFSVVVPAYHEEKYILATLRSLAEQTNTNCEFLIVSNGEPSGNATQKICELCGFKVVHDPIGGIARARQTGLKVARGEIVVTTDADTVHHRKWLDHIEKIMEDERILCGAGTWRTTSNSISVHLVFAFVVLTWRVKNYFGSRFITGVSEAASFYRRLPALAAGGYDPEVFLSEGLVMFRKLRNPNVPIIFFDDELAVYTSGRRLEKLGAFKWLLRGTWNASLQLLGRKGVDAESYPHHIR